MADQRDILGEMPGNRSNKNNEANSQDNSSESSQSSYIDIDLLKSIDATLKTILKEGPSWSQSNASDAMPGRRYTSGNNRWSTNRRSKKGKYSPGVDGFGEGLRDALVTGLTGSDFKQEIQSALSGFADILGVELEDVPSTLGKQLGKDLAETFKNSDLGKSVKEQTGKLGKNIFGGAIDRGKKSLEKYDKKYGTNYSSQFGQGAEKVKASVANAKDQSNTSAQDSAASSPVSSSSVSETSSGVYASSMSASSIEISGDVVINVSGNVTTQKSGKVGKKKNRSKGKGANLLEASDSSELISPDNAENLAQSAAETLQSDATAGNNALDAVKTAAKLPQSEVATTVEGAGGTISDLIGSVTSEAGSGITNIVSNLGSKMGPMLEGLTAGGTASGAALTFFASAAGPAIIAVVGLQVALALLGPALEGFGKLLGGLWSAGNRYNEQRKKNLELEKTRISEDVKSMIEEPFEILKDAANELYDVWDSQLRTITATQGYTKADLQDLMSSYSQRIKDEGLSKVVSGADITENLAKVLESGLQGQAADEFAYIATKLNAAIPTQDFFNYADTYQQLAANAIKNGQSQEAALKYANQQLENFASNILYAGRELSGGFSTGLQDAQDLFKSSANIALTSRIGDITSISGVLASVAAIVGSVAPDLSSNIVEAVVNSAVGGNSSDIVALRSVAGINASNTEFLNMLAQNPQQVFTSLFRGLANMQNMSNDNYMEVAEGLSNIFGISMDAFARIDFNYLADAISSMNMNNQSLAENLSLLKSGQTTTTADQLKMQQINEYMIDEGLSYMIDNEVARMIQEHMWDEQLARELQETEYAVNLQGAALDFLEGISQTVQNIIDFLNPLSWMKKLVTNIVATEAEVIALQSDIRSVLELGKVGQGNATSLMQLTTTNADLNLVPSLVNLMGGFSKYSAINSALQIQNSLHNVGTLLDMGKGLGNSLLTSATSPVGSLETALGTLLSNNIRKSRYTWANVSKSDYESLLGTAGVTSAYASYATQSGQSASRSNSYFEKFLNTAEQAVEENLSYEEWKATASNYGIADFQEALDSYGSTEAELQGYFTSNEASQAAKAEHERDLKEEHVWEDIVQFVETDHPDWRAALTELENTQISNQETQIAKQKEMIELLKASNTYLFDGGGEDTQQSILKAGLGKLRDLYNKTEKYVRDWTEYYITHSVYGNSENGGVLGLQAVKAIQQAEKRENTDAILALAKALDTSDLKDLLDPTLQTNALLAKILIVVESIMQQNNKAGGVVLPNSLAALGLGITESI